MSRLGKMKMRVAAVDEPADALQAQLGISHPNITGMQMDQLTRMYVPARFVRDVKVSFNGELVFAAETDISVSENPNFRFYFVPDREGDLTAEVVDSEGMKFTHSYHYTAESVSR